MNGGAERERERERWRQARALFDEAVALPPAERAEFVDAHAGHEPELKAELVSLLDALDDASGFLAGTHVGALAPGPETSAEEIRRERIGPWRVVRELGRGGMGVVYLAERTGGDFAQRAAIKVVTGGPENAAIVQRFRAERRILAGLEHPGIARLLDGGTTEDGSPYFVMESVEGEPLLGFADGRRLDLERRVELFLEVCAAVEHAHARLVLHRDVKPSNIVVGPDGRPRLLDFGIGKLLAPDGDGAPERTLTMERWYTPRYASPEQILGEPTTTATDVYGLGVVLYELLAGAPPYQFRGSGPREMESAVLEQSPRRLSSAAAEGAGASERAAQRATSAIRLRRQLRGDLDKIVGRALERDPARRYLSVGELSADLRRFLRGEPVLARPASRRYRLAKFVRRNRWAVATVAGVAVAAAAFSIYHVAVLRRERTAAQREAANATEIASFLSKLFEGANPQLTGGATLTARDLLDRGEERIAARKDLDATVRARLLVTMALARENLGEISRAHELAKRAADLHESAGSPLEDQIYAQLLDAHYLGLKGQGLRAIPILERAVALAESDPEVTLKTRGSATTQLGNAYYLMGDEERAKAAYEKDIEIEKQIGSPARIGSALNNLGAVLVNMGDETSGRARYREAVTYYERSTEKTAYEIYLSLYNLGELDLGKGDLGAAELNYRRGMAAYEAVFGAESAEVAWGITALAEIERRRGQLERARGSIDRALAIYSKVLEPGFADWSWPLQVSGKVYLAEGDRAAAIVELERALANERAQDGDRSFWIEPIEEALAEARGSGAAVPSSDSAEEAGSN